MQGIKAEHFGRGNLLQSFGLLARKLWIDIEVLPTTPSQSNQNMEGSEDERTNHEFLEDEASRPRARVVVLHRENDTAAGAQVEMNSYGSPFHFDVELARQGCSVVYPAAPQTRSRGAGAPFGGYRQSGNGREGGVWGLEDFLEVKSVSGWQ